MGATVLLGSLLSAFASTARASPIEALRSGPPAGSRMPSGNLAPKGPVLSAPTLPIPVPAFSIPPFASALLERIEFHGTRPERAFMAQMVERMLASPTARRYAQRLARTDAKIDVSLADWDGSRIAVEDGREVIVGRNGYSVPTSGGASISINRLFMKVDHAWAATKVPAILAHEMLGHGLHRYKAREAGVDGFYHDYWGNERAAKLIGWTVNLELERSDEDTRPREYVRHPVTYTRKLRSLELGYALAYSRAEANHLVRAMSNRLADLSWAQRRNEKTAREYENWKRTIDALTAKGARPNAVFASLSREIDDWLDHWDFRREQLRGIKSVIRKYRRWLGTSAGRSWQWALRRAMRNPFFEASERELSSLERRLRVVASRQKPVNKIIDPSQITWRQLAALKAAYARWGRR